MAANTDPPPFEFTAHPSTAPFAVSQQAYLSQHPDDRFGYIATGAVVFDSANGRQPRILLVQRAASDTMPYKWEIPGGACDNEDKSILHAMARELWEETGLHASHVEWVLHEPHFFNTNSGKKIGKFVFIVQAHRDADDQLNVRLDPEEHQHFLWATLDEVKAKKVGDLEIEFTTSDLENAVLQAFAHIEETRT